MWAPATVIIKMLITIPFTRKKDSIVNAHNVIATVPAFLISGIGCYIANAVFMGGFEAGSIAYLLGGGLIQSGGRAVVFIFVGLLLDKMGFKKKFLAD